MAAAGNLVSKASDRINASYDRCLYTVQENIVPLGAADTRIM